MEYARKDTLSISEQALLLLDDKLSPQKRNSLDFFANVDHFIQSSLGLKQENTKAGPSPSSSEQASSNAFTVAARLGRGNYEENAKNEAIVNALQRLRNRPDTSKYSSGRIIRSN